MLARPCLRRRGLREGLEVGGGDARAAHQVLGERLARLDLPGAAVGTEDVEARVPQRVAGAGLDRGLGAEHDQPHLLAFGEVDQADDVGRADGNVAGHSAGAAVAGCAVHALDELRLDALPDERVLTRPRPDDENFHGR